MTMEQFDTQLTNRGHAMTRHSEPNMHRDETPEYGFTEN